MGSAVITTVLQSNIRLFDFLKAQLVIQEVNDLVSPLLRFL
jgi:hypothetical protein